MTTRPNLYANEVPGFDDLTGAKRKEIEIEAQLAQDKRDYFNLTQTKISGVANTSGATNVERVLNGEDVTVEGDVESQLKHKATRIRALEEASHVLQGQVRTEMRKAAVRVCAASKSEDNALRAELAEATATMFAAYLKYFDFRRGLLESGAGLIGLCENFPDFIGGPSRMSDFASYLREEKKAGLVKQRLPKEIA